MATHMQRQLPAHQAGEPEKVKRPWIDLKEKNRDKKVKTRNVDMVSVYFPQGHSTRMDLSRARELGYLEEAPVVDMETGEVIQPRVNLARLVEQKTRRKGYETYDDIVAAAKED